MKTSKCIIFFLLVGFLMSGCDRKKHINGIGTWILGETTLASAPGVCPPRQGEVIVCSQNGSIPIGEQQSDVVLYFRKDNVAEKKGRPTDRLVEIELSISRCRMQAVQEVLFDILGKPSWQKGRVSLLESERYFCCGKSSRFRASMCSEFCRST